MCCTAFRFCFQFQLAPLHPGPGPGQVQDTQLRTTGYTSHQCSNFVSSGADIVKPRQWQHIAVVVVGKEVPDYLGGMNPKTIRFYVNGRAWQILLARS